MSGYAIPDDLIAAAIADRGNVHPWETIPVARTALIVIDMQNYFVAPDAQGEAETARDIVPAINRLAGELRGRGGRVVWMQNTTTDTREKWSVRHELLPPDKAETRLAAMELGAEGYQFWPTLDVRTEDTRMVKKFYSAFIQGSSDLAAYLRTHGIEFVLIAGTYTNVCCQASAQDAMMLNFRTIMVSDCNAGSTAETHAAALNNFFEFFGDVLSVDEVLGRLGSKSALKRLRRNEGADTMATTVPEKTALVVVDMQNDYCNARGVYPRNGLNCFDMDSVVPATVAAVSACKAHAIPVIYLRMAWNTDARGFPIDAGLIIEQSRPFIRTEGLRRGTWGAEVLAEMPPPDYVVEKTRYSGFHNSSLEALLRGLGVDTICLAGVITNMCVEATARDAFHRDFRFVVLSDCVSGFSRKLHDASLETLQIFGRVAASGDLFAGTSLQD